MTTKALTHRMLGNFSSFFFCWLFKIIFFKKIFRENYQIVKHLDPDQDQQFVGPDLGPNCLQRLSVVNSHHKQAKS